MTDSEKRTFKDQFMLRLPDGMRERIKLAADESGRSMNAEIVETLREKYPEPLPDIEAAKVVAQFMSLPKKAQDEFVHKWLQENVSDEDIRDGLMPGVRLKK